MVANGLYFDTATMYYRAFFAVPESVTAPDGTPSGAVRGFLDMAAAFIATNPANQIVFAWDTDWRPAWRVELVPSYKAHRVDEESVSEGFEEIPDNLSPQISAIAEILDAVGLARLGQVDFEADDILGTLISKVGSNAIVVTGDRDLFQLVSDQKKLRVISMNKGMKNLETITDKYLLDRYGITGAQYVAYATLRGDSSDGLPGVKGVGEKTASELINRYGDLEKILKVAKANAPEIKPSVKSNLIASEDYILKAQKVVQVRVDGKIPKNILKPTKVKHLNRLSDLATDWGVVKQVNRLLKSLEIEVTV